MDEASLSARRINHQMANEMSLLQQAVSGVLDKKANKAFRATLKELTGG